MTKDPHTLSDLQILALTIAGESRGSSRSLQMGIANVISNRWTLAQMGRVYKKAKSVKDICLWPYQFSCWLSNDPNRIWINEVINRGMPERALDILVYTKILDISHGWLKKIYSDNVERADHYHCFPEGHSAWPKWAKNREPVRIIETTKFYKLF